MTDRSLLAPARAVLAAWDRIEEAKGILPTLEGRLLAIKPHQDAFTKALSDLRTALDPE